MLWFILDRKYGFDEFNELVIARSTRVVGDVMWKVFDDLFIDGYVVNGLALKVRQISARIRVIQSGFVYHYAFAMIVGLFLLITWFAAK